MFVMTNIYQFRVDEGSYVYDADHGALLELDPEADRWLARFLDSGSSGRSRHDDPALDSSRTYEIVDELRRAHLLTFATPDAPAVRPLERSEDLSAAPISSLVAIISQACNLACTYCYAKGGQYGSRARMMKPDVGRKAIDFLFAHAGQSPSVHVTFFGGEPLMNMATLKDMVAYGRGCAERSGTEITFSVTTNGTCFGPEVVRFLDQERIGVVVSLDGPSRIHDRYRVFRSGAGSYQVVAGGLKTLFGGYRARPVKARVTVTRHALNLVDIFFHLRELGFHEIGFSPVSTNGTTYGLQAKHLAQFVAEFARLAEMFVEHAMRGAFLGVSSLVGLLGMIHHGERKCYPCGAGIGLVAVDAQGTLAFCQRFVGDDCFRLGHLKTGLDPGRRSDLQVLGHLSRKEACRTCWAHHLCAGGCHYDAWLANGSVDEPDMAHCEFYRAMLDVGLRTYVQLSQSAPAFLRRLFESEHADCTVAT